MTTVHSHFWLDALLRSGDDELVEKVNLLFLKEGRGSNAERQIEKASMSKHKGNDTHHGTKCCMVPTFFLGC